MQKFHPSPVRHILFAACAFIFASLLAFALQSVFPAIPATALSIAAAVLSAAYAAAAFLHARMTSYSLEDGSLKMEKRFLAVEQQIIPIKSIDNLRIKLSVVGRFLSLADVYVDTPGGDGFEMVLLDIPQAAAEQLAEEVEQSKKSS